MMALMSLFGCIVAS
jgi:proton glutamate symport protein